MSDGKDLLIYFALCAFPIASFMLLNYPDVQFYVSLFLVSALVIAWMHVYRKDSGSRLVEYDHNLTGGGVLLILGGVIGTLVSATFFVSSFANSSLYVPTAGLEMSVGSLVVPKFWSDVLFQLTLVAPAEEASKLVTSLALFDRLKGGFSMGLAKTISICVPIFIWAILHTYRNPQYMGEYMTVMVGSAFVAGLIMFAVMHYTKSLLGAVLVHGTYNACVIYLASLALP